MSRFHTIKGLFGQLIHYKDGRRVGESWEGLFDGSYNHYSDEHGYVGYSDPGLFADQVHHGASGEYLGETYKDPFGISRHYSQDGYIGDSYNGLFSEVTDFNDAPSDIFDPPSDNFDW